MIVVRLALVLGITVAILVPSWYFARYEARSQRRSLDAGHWVLGIGMTMLCYLMLALAIILVFGLVQVVYWIITGNGLPGGWE